VAAPRANSLPYNINRPTLNIEWWQKGLKGLKGRKLQISNTQRRILNRAFGEA
jgi:hypothetical protein